MRILEIISGTQPNGAVLQCIAMIRELVRRDHEITLVCRPGAWIAGRLADLPVEIIESDLSRWPAGELRRIAALAGDKRIQLLHTHMSRGHSFGLLLHWLSRKPIVATAHNCRLHPHWCCNDFVIANSQATLNYHRRWNRVPRGRSETVPYLIDLDRFADTDPASRDDLRREWGLAHDDLLLGIIGDVSGRKGHLHLVRALPRIVAAVPQARLAIVGNSIPAYRDRVLAEARRLKVAERIVWTGYRDDIPQVMQALDVCVSAAMEEALGLTMPEALAAGKPVVATRVGGLPENILPGESGLLVPPAAPRAMADAIVHLLENAELRASMGAVGRRHMQEKYNTPRDVARTEQILASVIRTSPKTKPKTAPGRPLVQTAAVALWPRWQGSSLNPAPHPFSGKPVATAAPAAWRGRGA